MEVTMHARSFALLTLLVLLPAPLWAADGATAPGGYGILLFKMVFVLGGVCLLAWVSLRWGLKRFVAPDRHRGGAMEVLARLPLEPRRSLLVVRVASRCLVLSSSETGIETIAELEPEDATVFESQPGSDRSFRDVLATLKPHVSRETSPEEA